MPTQRQYKLPQGKSHSEFEDIVTDVLRTLWDDPEARRYGRSGQNQHGVDIIGTVHLFGQPVGQGLCQVRASSTIDWTKAERSLAAADEHFTPIQFVLATAAPRSTQDQDYASALSTRREEAGLCRVVLLSWDELEEVILADDVLLHRHYPEYVKTITKQTGVSRNATALIAVASLFVGGLLVSAGEGDDDDFD